MCTCSSYRHAALVCTRFGTRRRFAFDQAVRIRKLQLQASTKLVVVAHSWSTQQEQQQGSVCRWATLEHSKMELVAFAQASSPNGTRVIGTTYAPSQDGGTRGSSRCRQKEKEEEKVSLEKDGSANATACNTYFTVKGRTATSYIYIWTSVFHGSRPFC